jgi:hypothetical protein
MYKADEQDKVVIAKTDADGPGRELGNRYGVQGFPSKLPRTVRKSGRLQISPKMVPSRFIRSSRLPRWT